VSTKLPKRDAPFEASAEAEQDDGQILDLDTRFDLSAFGSERREQGGPARPAPAEDASSALAAFPSIASAAPPARTHAAAPTWPPPLSAAPAVSPQPHAPQPDGPSFAPVPQAPAASVWIAQPTAGADDGVAVRPVVPPPPPPLEDPATGPPPPRLPAATVLGGGDELAGPVGISRETSPEAALPTAVETGRRWPILPAAIVLSLAVLMAAGLSTWRSRAAAPAPPPTGELTVDSTPAGASVIIAGKDRGRTPVSVALPPGSYDVELRAGRERHVLAARVTAGATTAQHFVLRAGGPSHGQLRVTSDPPSATVTVDGKPRGRTPVLVSDLDPGQHEVVVTGPAGPVKKRVQVDADTTTMLAVPLPRAASAPAPAAVDGWVAVKSPVELQVFEGDRLLGTTRVDRLMLKTGAHTLRFANEAAGVNVSRPVRIEPGKTTRVEVAVPTGLLSVNASPWATVSIDGREVGETPLGNLEVPAGSHEVVFTHPELGERRQRITLRAGITTRLSVDMRR
jgi:hypothetical protein